MHICQNNLSKLKQAIDTQLHHNKKPQKTTTHFFATQPDQLRAKAK